MKLTPPASGITSLRKGEPREKEYNVTSKRYWKLRIRTASIVISKYRKKTEEKENETSGPVLLQQTLLLIENTTNYVSGQTMFLYECVASKNDRDELLKIGKRNTLEQERDERTKNGGRTD